MHTCTQTCHRQVSISFSLVVSYATNQKRHSCTSLSNINEGILLSATSSNTNTSIHFYYSANNYANQNQNPQVTEISTNILELSYNDGHTFTVPSTFDNQKGQLSFTAKTSYFNGIVSLMWEQHSRNIGSHCDVWSLDNVEVAVQYENCTRTILSEDFEDMEWVLAT